MKKLLLGMTALLAVNVYGQSISGPTVFNSECIFVHNFVDEHYFYTTTVADNKTDCTLHIYNDELRNIKNISVEKATYDFKGGFQEGATIYSLIEVELAAPGYDVDEESVLTQTLFNRDLKWEMIRGTYICKKVQNNGYTRNVCELTKVEIINEEGKVLGDIPVEAVHGNSSEYPESYLHIKKMGENFYFLRETENYNGSNDEITTTFWKITKDNGSGVNVLKAAEFKSYPNPVRQSEVFTIEIDPAYVQPGNIVEICDQNGRIVKQQPITSNEVKVSTRQLKGLYIYNIVSNGKPVNTGKVIVQ